MKIKNQLFQIGDFIKELYSITKIKFFIILIFGVLNSFFQALSVVIIIPLLETYQSGSKTSIVAKSLYYLGWNGSLEWILVFYFIILFLYAIFKSLYTFESSKLVVFFTKEFTTQSLDKILQSPWSFFTKHEPSKLTVLFHTETLNLKTLTLVTFRIIQIISLIVIQLIMSFWLSWQITLVTFLALAFIYLVQKKIVSTNISLGQKRIFFSEKIQKYLTETFKGIKLLKIHQLEKERFNNFKDTQEELYLNESKTAKLEGISDFFFITTGALVIVTIIYLSIHFNFLKIGGLLVLLVLLFKVIGHLQSLIKSIATYLNLLPSYQLITSIVADTQTITERNKQENDQRIISNIEFNNISFSYGNRIIIDHKNQLFQKGKIYLFFGPSGKGKTTTLDLLSGLIHPQSGEIKVDGVEINLNNIHTLQNNISYVLQETILFQGSILENISLGHHYTSEEITHAIQSAGLSQTISVQPEGIDTIINENASMLSGGEKQRIAIARALIRNTSILLLDEITSSLDARNEAQIMDTISKIKEDKIILIVGHREKLKDWADEVIEF
jgi:ABC-type multidrug transport system fused ATPase/permease subunit